MKSLWFKVWAGVLAIIALIFVVGLIQYSTQQAIYDDELREANARMRLYTATSGKQLGDPSIERKLGEDLYAFARSHQGQLDEFQGDSNAYGGITEAIGDDPFNGVNCSECGPLKPEWEERLEHATKVGADLEQLTGYPEKPSNWSRTFATLALIWLFFLPALFGASRFLERRRRLAIYGAEDRHLIESLDRQLAQGESDPELLQLRIGLREALQERADAGKSERNELLIDRLKGQARDRLEAIEEGNKHLSLWRPSQQSSEPSSSLDWRARRRR